MTPLALVGFCAVVSAVLILLFRPVMARMALAQPNARGSHATATPQGGGVAVMAAVVLGVGIAWMVFPALQPEFWRTGLVLASALVLMFIGLLDDVRGLAVAPRFIAQFLCAALVLASLPPEARILPGLLPLSLERVLLLFGVVWFVNLTNFLDGLDLMTVAEVTPKTAAIALLSLLGAVPPAAAIAALALLGGMLGFAPFNTPRARLFLGDAGSLSVGLLMAWLLILLAVSGHLAAALLIPLYSLADTAITVLRRFLAGEVIYTPHRSHFYQRATDNGLSVPAVTTRVFLLNVVLAVLAGLAVAVPYGLADLALLAAGALVTAAVLAGFEKGAP